MDHNTQQLDDNNAKSEVNPDVSPDANFDSGQEIPPPEATPHQSPKAGGSESLSSMSAEERKAALEAIIYAADEPATIEQLASALGEPKAAVQVALDELVASYASDSRGIEIRGVAGGYKMYTKPQHHDLVRRFIKSLRPPLRLTMPALETLAVISYKQPVTAPEIQEIRGVNTSGVIKTLLDKKLITTAGRKEVIGRPILYRTSKEFLMRFGLSDLGELPSLKEFEALAREALGSDEGVAESDAGDESVLDSLEPTEAEAVAELEAAASETSGDAQTPSGEQGTVEPQQSSAPQQYEQSISSDVTEAIASHPMEAAATLQPEADSMDGVAASQHAAESVSESEATQTSPGMQQASESGKSTEAMAQQSDSVAEANNIPESAEPVEQQPVHGAGIQPTPETAEDSSEPASRPIVDAVAQIHDAEQSISTEPRFAEREPARAESIRVETPESLESSTEHETAFETEHEISDEILAQLAQGIEIEVSADSLASLSSGEVPAEESPAQSYSSETETERQPLPTAPSSENVAEQGSEHAKPESESSSEPEKSRKAAAGE